MGAPDATERVLLGHHRREPFAVASWEPPPWTADRDDTVTRNDNGVIAHSVEVGEFRLAADFLDENGDPVERVDSVSVCQVDRIDVDGPSVRVERQPATIWLKDFELKPLAALRLAELLGEAVALVLGPDAALLHPDEPEADR